MEQPETSTIHSRDSASETHEKTRDASRDGGHKRKYILVVAIVYVNLPFLQSGS